MDTYHPCVVARKIVVVPEERKKPAKLINKMNHPIQLSYDGKGMMLSPREKAVIANFDLLGALPRGVMVVPMWKK